MSNDNWNKNHLIVLKFGIDYLTLFLIAYNFFKNRHFLMKHSLN